MNQRVAIVTDSTASIPTDTAEKLGICVLQLELKIGDEDNDERRVPHPDLARAMRDDVPVATGAPPVPAFFWNYSDAAASGVDAIVSVHISEGLSQTCESARQASQELNLPIYVVDSRLVGLGLGYPAMAAAEAANAGATVQGVLGVLDQRLRSTTQLLYVDTLEYLRRGGRVGRAQAAFGKALSVKPLLILKDGHVEPLTKSVGTDRTLKKALETAVKRAGDAPVDVGVEHFQCDERAAEMLERLRGAIPNVRRSTLTETTAILGAHAGPGAFGITISPAS